VFHEAWRVERDFYWERNEGQIGRKSASAMKRFPWVAHRSDLNYIIGEMIAN